jgi:DNA replication protein DnaC
VERWLSDYSPESRGILIHGPTGVGKTRLAYAIALDLALNHGADARFLEWPEHFGAYASAARRRDGSDHAMMERDVVLPDVVIIDEVKGGNSWQVEHFERIIGARVEAQRTTIITTNLIPGQPASNEHSVAAAFGDRVDSRLCSLRWLGMGGEDYRRVR